MRTLVIAVAGGKGSPGVTFVSAGIGLHLAAGGLDTLLVDCDGEERGLAPALGVPPSALGPGSPVEIARSLRLLEAEATDGRELADSCRHQCRAVVADLGHHPGAFQQQFAMAADWLLWVVAGDRLGLGRAEGLLSRPPLLAGSCGLLLNRCRGGAVRALGLKLAQQHRLPLMGVLSEREPAAARPLLERMPHRDRRLGPAFRALSRTLHPEALEALPSWP